MLLISISFFYPYYHFSPIPCVCNNLHVEKLIKERKNQTSPSHVFVFLLFVINPPVRISFVSLNCFCR